MKIAGKFVTVDDVAESRFWSKVRVSKDCWFWNGAIRSDGRHSGYGVFNLNGTTVKAHRLAYTLLVGEIPKGMTLDHKCHSIESGCAGGAKCVHRSCVNPNHLEPVTHSENARRSVVGGRIWRRSITHCPQGHEYTEENTYYLPNRNGHRACRSCRGKRSTEFSRKKRAGLLV